VAGAQVFSLIGDFFDKLGHFMWVERMWGYKNGAKMRNSESWSVYRSDPEGWSVGFRNLMKTRL
jgi:hypothetical protein